MLVTAESTKSFLEVPANILFLEQFQNITFLFRVSVFWPTSLPAATFCAMK